MVNVKFECTKEQWDELFMILDRYNITFHVSGYPGLSDD